MTSGALTFSLIEVLALLGFAQCVMILVYLAFRAKHPSQALPAMGYFFFLAIYFSLTLFLRFDEWRGGIVFSLFCVHGMGPPLCYLLVRQAMYPEENFGLRHILVLSFVPSIFFLIAAYARFTGYCGGTLGDCARFYDLLPWIGGITGTLCLLFIWASGHGLSDLMLDTKSGRERYWLIIALIVANVADVGLQLVLSAKDISQEQGELLQVIFGLVFAYLVTTILFRVYPNPLQLYAIPRGLSIGLTDDEKAVEEKVRRLIELEKLYHEPGFGRAELAREAGVSESNLSRIVNYSFGKSLPKLLNELRTEDAKRMLLDPAIPVSVVAKEVGFSSIASFNRVFKDQTGDAPTAWREKNTK